MENAAFTLVFILGPSLTHACTLISVTQNPPVLVALSGNEVKVLCEIKVSSDSGDMSSFLYHHERPTEDLNTWSGPAKNHTVTHNLSVTKTGMYYCRATCRGSHKDGQGTYIHVRDSGYMAPSSTSYQLCSGLISLSILLLIPAVSGTYLVLPYIWKTEAQSPARTRGQSPAVIESSGSKVEDVGGSLYTSLEPRSEEVYDILEDGNMSKDPGEPKKHQAVIHDVAPRSPKRKAKLQPKTSSLLEKPQIKPKPKKNVSEHDVYENFRL